MLLDLNGLPLTDLPGILSVISVLLTFKIFEACADFLTPDGHGSCRKHRNFVALIVLSCSHAVALRLGGLGFLQI